MKRLILILLIFSMSVILCVGNSDAGTVYDVYIKFVYEVMTHNYIMTETITYSWEDPTVSHDVWNYNYAVAGAKKMRELMAVFPGGRAIKGLAGYKIYENGQWWYIYYVPTRAWHYETHQYRTYSDGTLEYIGAWYNYDTLAEYYDMWNYTLR